jgi:peptidase M49-like protein
MKYIWIAIVSGMISACGGQNTEQPVPEQKSTLPVPIAKVPDAKKDAKKDVPAANAQKKETEKELAADPRQAALEKEYSAYAEKLLTHSAAGLPDDEKEMLRHLLKAASLIEDLHMLQIHPDNLKMRDRVMASGTDIEKRVFNRYQMPWCGDNTATECVAIEDAPARKIGWALWPAGDGKLPLSSKEYDSLGLQINGTELLSPFTQVVRNEGAGFTAIPFARTDLLGSKMKAVAVELREAAAKASDKSLKKFLESRAAALESKSAFPYDESDYDWIALEGDWEVTVGPYETYKGPYQLKALFEMYIGREDKKLTADLARFKDNLQDMENALGALVGTEIYGSRKLDPRITIRAVDIWMASGDGRRDRGATVAFHLPNRGRSVDEGLYKKVMMVNHSLAFESVTRARAGLVLDEKQFQFVDVRADITNVTFHEFSHGFGAYHEMKVRTPKGKTSTVKQALREYDSLFEEAKADTMGLWLIQFEKGKGWIDEDMVKRRYTSGFMHILGLLQYPLAGTYPRMVALQLGWYLDAGAIEWNVKGGRFKIDYAKIPGAIESLAKKVATIQLTGDYAQADELVKKYISKNGDNDYSLNGALGEARKAMMDKFEAAGIKSPSLQYEITGL